MPWFATLLFQCSASELFTHPERSGDVAASEDLFLRLSSLQDGLPEKAVLEGEQGKGDELYGLELLDRLQGTYQRQKKYGRDAERLDKIQSRKLTLQIKDILSHDAKQDGNEHHANCYCG